MERETKTIKTPVGGNEVKIISYLIGSEKRILATTKDTNDMRIKGIELIVKSIDGKTETISEIMDDMHGKDFDFILLEVNKVIIDSSYQEKKS